MSRLLRTLTLFWTGLTAGYFWSMHHSIMPGLSEIDPAAAMLAMRAITSASDTAIFGIVFFGAALLHLAVVIDSMVNWTGVAAKLVFVASGLFLIGVVLPTLAAHFHLESMIALIDLGSPTFVSDWMEIAIPWSTWNDLRTGASIGSFLLLTVTFSS